jgi:hypothetical protein
MSDSERYYLCVTCGRLKHRDLFEVGECTCDDCHEADRHSANYREATNGEGYVRTSQEGDDE